MLRVYQITLPTPYRVGPVNIYVIKNRPVTLIDTGADTPEAYKVLRHMLALLNVDINDIERLLITHSHPDHAGMAAKIAALSGAVTMSHEIEFQKMAKFEEIIGERVPYLLEMGIGLEELQVIQDDRNEMPGVNMAVEKVRTLTDGDWLEFDEGALQVLHLPGHSPGHLCFYSPEQKFFFSGDFMISHISPNPLLEPDPDHPGRRLPTLGQYLDGLKQVEKLDISVVFPGHGGVFSDYHGVIAGVREHHEQQVNLILNRLKGGELNVYQLCRKVYSGIHGWSVFLGLSEIQANLDWMMEYRLVRSNKRDGIVYYQKTN
ncbi:MAG: MBL fold metallo-hydrolase [Firmicutes bacterium]|nr:MBL fold metallo-hydrolase [Bacillota bacterium]